VHLAFQASERLQQQSADARLTLLIVHQLQKLANKSQHLRKAIICLIIQDKKYRTWLNGRSGTSQKR